MLTVQITSIPLNPPHLPYCFCILHHRLQNRPSLFSLNEMPKIYFSFKVTRTPRAIHGLCVCVYTCMCACVYVRVSPHHTLDPLELHLHFSFSVTEACPSPISILLYILSFPSVPQDRAQLLRRHPGPVASGLHLWGHPRGWSSCVSPHWGRLAAPPSPMLQIIRQKSLKIVTSWVVLLS